MCAVDVLRSTRIPMPKSLANGRLAHPKGKQKRHGRKAHGGRNRRQLGRLVARPHHLRHLGRQLPDVIQVLADALLNLAGVVADQPAVELPAEDLLQDGGADADADAGAERAEEVGAGDDDGGVLDGGVGEEANERCRDAFCTCQR